jgi:hypothetical protein
VGIALLGTLRILGAAAGVLLVVVLVFYGCDWYDRRQWKGLPTRTFGFRDADIFRRALSSRDEISSLIDKGEIKLVYMGTTYRRLPDDPFLIEHAIFWRVEIKHESLLGPETMEKLWIPFESTYGEWEPPEIHGHVEVPKEVTRAVAGSVMRSIRALPK